MSLSQQASARPGACWADRYRRIWTRRPCAPGPNLTVLGDHRHLGTLAMHVDTDVDRHCRVSDDAKTRLAGLPPQVSRLEPAARPAVTPQHRRSIRDAIVGESHRAATGEPDRLV